MYKIPVIIFLLFSCTQNQSDSALVDCTSTHSAELQSAAANGKSYSANFYHIITETEAKVYTVENGGYSVVKTLERGEVIQKVTVTKIQEGYDAIRVGDDSSIYYLKRPYQSYQQLYEGMRFPVMGIVAEENQFVKVRNKEYPLEVGTPYFYVINKGGAIINVLDPNTKEILEGDFPFEPKLCQTEDHLKINPKFKSKLSAFLNAK